LGNSFEAEVVGVGGVDAPDERVDQSFVHLTTEACAHDCTEAIMFGLSTWEHDVESSTNLC
jgi:hypothetical protein